MTDTPAARPAPLGYDDLPRLVAVMTGDEKHAASADSTAPRATASTAPPSVASSGMQTRTAR